MSTAEDVFYLYERNSRYYHDCKFKNSIEKCEDYSKNECCCSMKQKVMPFTIGDQYGEPNLKIKCYIKPGDECPICYEPILTKLSAFITSCGHQYHKKCLFKYMETKWLSTSYISTVKCPMCRSSLGHPEFEKRYHDSYFIYYVYNNNRYKNGLDQLEDFWLTKDYKLPIFCSNRYDHYLATDKNCFICKSYREKGELLYVVWQP